MFPCNDCTFNNQQCPLFHVHSLPWLVEIFSKKIFAPFHCHFVNCGWNLHTSTTVLGAAPMTVLGMVLHVVVGCTQKSRLGQVRVCFPAPPMEPPPNHNCVRGGAHDCIRGCAACGGRVDTEESVRVGLGLFSCTMDGTSTPPLLVLCLECNMLNSSSRAQLWCVNRLMPQP
jgi:hypothetical protein